MINRDCDKTMSKGWSKKWKPPTKVVWRGLSGCNALLVKLCSTSTVYYFLSTLTILCLSGSCWVWGIATIETFPSVRSWTCVPVSDWVSLFFAVSFFIHIEITTVATANGLSSDKDKKILNFFFLKILLTIFLVFPSNLILGFPDLILWTIISLKFIPLAIPVPIAFENASLAANLLA